MEQGKKKSLFSKARMFFYVLAILLFIGAFYYFSDIKKSIKLFKQVDPYWLTLAIFAQAFTYLLGAVIYQQLLRVFNNRLSKSIWKLFQVSIVTLFFNQTVPTAGISGNTFFFNFLQKKKVATDHIVSLISIELLSFYAAMEIIIILATVIGLLIIKMPPSLLIVLGAGFMVYFIFGLAIEFLSKKNTLNTIYKKLGSLKPLTKLADKLRKSFPANIHIKSPSKFFRQHKTVVYKITALQILIFLSDSTTIFALFSGFGVHITLLVAATGLILTKIISMLPVSPGGLILYEGGMALFFSRLGVGLGSAVVATLLYRALSFWLPILAGFILYKKLENE